MSDIICQVEGWKASGDSARGRISAPGEDVNELSAIGMLKEVG